jgi:hypothetical protein
VGFKSKHSTNQDYSLADTLISNYNEIDYKKINELIN